MDKNITIFSQRKLTLLQIICFYVKATLLMLLLLIISSATRLVLFLLKPLSKTTLKYKRFMFSRMTTGMLFLFKVRLKVTGKIPKPPYILMSNHISYLDIVVIASLTGTPFVAKREVRDWPIIGWIAELYGGLFINREKRSDVMRFPELLANRINKGGSIAIFPEGTSTNGQEVLPFYSSLFQWPAKNEFPIHTCSISYRTGNPEKTPASQFVCWWGDMDFMPHYRALLNLHRIHATIHFSEKAISSSCRKELAKKTHQEVVAHFIQSERAEKKS